MRPIDVWPVPKFRGRPGYSAQHFRRMAGTDNSPRAVALRIVDEQCDLNNLDERLAAMTRVNENWSALLAALESVAGKTPWGCSPDYKRVMREVRRKARAATERAAS